MTTPTDILSYLASIKNAKITRILPCYVSIGRRTYPAAHYWETMQHSPGTDAYRRGEREYTREMFYCAGYLPSAKLRGNVAFTIAGEPCEWYIAAYSGKVTDRKQQAAEPNEHHPFGNMFLLAPWDAADGVKIDTYERHPYRRMTAHVGL